MRSTSANRDDHVRPSTFSDEDAHSCGLVGDRGRHVRGARPVARAAACASARERLDHDGRFDLLTRAPQEADQRRRGLHCLERQHDPPDPEPEGELALGEEHDGRNRDERAEVTTHGAQRAPARRLARITRVRDLAPEDAALEQGLPPFLVVSPDELHAGQLAVADLAGELVFVEDHDLPITGTGPEPGDGLNVVTGRRLWRPRGHELAGDGTRQRGRQRRRRSERCRAGRCRRGSRPAAARSSVFSNRSAGCLRRHRETIASRASGASGRNRRSGSASRSITAASTWAGVARRKTG